MAFLIADMSLQNFCKLNKTVLLYILYLMQTGMPAQTCGNLMAYPQDNPPDFCLLPYVQLR